MVNSFPWHCAEGKEALGKGGHEVKDLSWTSSTA